MFVSLYLISGLIINDLVFCKKKIGKNCEGSAIELTSHDVTPAHMSHACRNLSISILTSKVILCLAHSATKSGPPCSKGWYWRTFSEGIFFQHADLSTYTYSNSELVTPYFGLFLLFFWRRFWLLCGNYLLLGFGISLWIRPCPVY